MSTFQWTSLSTFKCTNQINISVHFLYVLLCTYYMNISVPFFYQHFNVLIICAISALLIWKFQGTIYMNILVHYLYEKFSALIISIFQCTNYINISVHYIYEHFSALNISIFQCTSRRGFYSKLESFSSKRRSRPQGLRVRPQLASWRHQGVRNVIHAS